jgi:hypothetical protein
MWCDMNELIEFILTNPSTLFFVAIIFLGLGASIVYLWQKPRTDYVDMLKKENDELRKSKISLLERLVDYKEMEDERERQSKK